MFFDPAVYRVIFLDQRGAGLSQPSSETRDNTTQLLIKDIEALREHVGVKKWHMVFGGSWGSTLALAYAQTHPEAVGSLVLRGVFLGTKAELDLVMMGQLTGTVWPEEYDRFVGYLPEDKRSDPLKSYHELVFSEDREKALEAAQEWNRWELSVSFLQQGKRVDIEEKLQDERWVMSHAKMELHYFLNGCFLEGDQLLKGCEKIKNIPSKWSPNGPWNPGYSRFSASIVQGRYDMVCPARAAWKIHRALPKSRLYWSITAGHSATVSPELLRYDRPS